MNTGAPGGRIEDRTDVLVARCRVTAFALAVAAVAASLVVVAAWIADVPDLYDVTPGSGASSALSAAALALVGCAVAVLARVPGPRGALRIALAAAGTVVVLLSATVLVEYLTSVDLGLDGVGIESTRPSVVGSVAQILLAGALIVVAVGSTHQAWAQVAAAAATTLGLASLLLVMAGGRAQQTFGGQVWMSLPSAVAVVALGPALMLVRSDAGPIAVITRPSAGGYLARRLLPVALAAPLLLAGLIQVTVELDWISAAAGAAFRAAAVIVFLASLVVVAATGADRVDRARAGAERYRRVLFADAPSGIVVVGEDGVIEEANPQAGRVFGYPPGVLDGRSVDVLVPEGIQARHVAFRRGYDAQPRLGPMGAGRPVAGRRADGTEFPADIRLAPTSFDGRPFVIAFVDDVTERRAAEDQLEETRALLEAILDHAPSQVFVKDLDGRYLIANRQVAVESGVPQEEMIGRSDAELFPGAEPWRSNDMEVITGLRPVEFEEHFDPGDGAPQTFLSQKFPLLDSEGRPYALGGISSNITARKLLEEALESARREAEAANLAKSQFLSRVSHELRTPLNSVLGFAQLLELDNDDPVVQESVGHILRAGRHLLQLINEVIDISRIEAGELTISVEPVRVAEVVGAAADLIRVQAGQHGLALRLDVPDAPMVLADRSRLLQVLLNLGSNAVKFNRPGGSVRFGVRVRGGRVRLSVADDGPGIAPEREEELFAPFERLGTDPAVEGTGLGLALSRGLVEAMGGRIGVDSEVGVGSTFWVDLPAAEPGDLPGGASGQAGEASGAAAARAPTRTVLSVDDNPESLAVIERLLRRRGHIRVVSAGSGALGLELAAAQPIDLALVDVHLPDIGGADVLARLRADPATHGVPVVMVSADHQAGTRQDLVGAGAFAVLDKPVVVTELLAIVDECCPDDEDPR